jgi:hypothetical protein
VLAIALYQFGVETGQRSPAVIGVQNAVAVSDYVFGEPCLGAVFL